MRERGGVVEVNADVLKEKVVGKICVIFGRAPNFVTSHTATNAVRQAPFVVTKMDYNTFDQFMNDVNAGHSERRLQ